MYEKGQVVYLSRDILGWFDKSMGNKIPTNTACIIEKVYRDPSSPENKYAYCVRFLGDGSEFGTIIVNDEDLKLYRF